MRPLQTASGLVNLIKPYPINRSTVRSLRLTRAEGYVFVIDQMLGVTSIPDPNANELALFFILAEATFRFQSLLE